MIQSGKDRSLGKRVDRRPGEMDLQSVRESNVYKYYKGDFPGEKQKG